MSMLLRLARAVGGVLRPRPRPDELLERAAEADGRGDHAEAERLCREALAIAPQSADAWMNLGLALQLQGRSDEALAAFERAAALGPGSAPAHYNLGRVHHQERRYAQAAAALARAVALSDEFVDARILLADALAETGERRKAVQVLRAALEIAPSHAGALHNCTQLLYAQGDIDAIVTMYRAAAAAADPPSPEATIGLALGLAEIGHVDQAIALLKRTLAAHPSFGRARIAYLFNLLLTDSVSAEDVAAEHRRIGALYESEAPPRAFPGTARKPRRPLRVGYVSGDLSAHSSSLFLEHVLENHDRDRVVPIAYSCSTVSDAYTERLRGKFDLWHDVWDAEDEALARLIASDGVDVLVDLSGYSSASRMGVFARRPAPVQVTWFAYVSTTGLPSMTHRLTDAVLDPPGKTEALNVEALQRMPHSVWCYRPPREARIDVAGAPAAGAVRFGAFNRYAKASATTLALWCAILRALPESTLTVLTVPAGAAQRELLTRFAAGGVEASRIRLAPRLSQPEYYAAYRDVDVCLDTTPYSGATTTCDALWMGLPVVTLRGTSTVSRSAASILTHAGSAEWVADSADEYVRIALDLGRAGPADAARRHTLRERFRASPLMAEAAYARDLEDAFEAMRTARSA